MTTALFAHPDAERHITPPGHPEQVARHAAHGFGKVFRPDDDERHDGDERYFGPSEV